METPYPPEQAIPRANILGVGISALTIPQTVAQITGWIERGMHQYVSVCTVHTVVECRRSPEMHKAVNQAGLATPDGMPLVWLSRRQTAKPVSRVYGPDLMLVLCQASVGRGYRHYFLGGAPGVPELLAQKMQAQFPGLQVAGYYSPPFRVLTPIEDGQLVARLNRANADIIWVGLGTPKQDLWMAAHRRHLTAAVLIGVGAAFDIHTDRVPQAPRWMQKKGLEWCFRLWHEPRRLWYRYLVYNPLFVMLILMQALRIKKYSLE